jgi:hypothetical protein
MDEVKQYLDERKQEVAMHLKLLAALEKRSMETPNSEDELNIDVKQVLILKASILVHLYNVIESTMTKSLEVIEDAIYSYHPKSYSDEVFNKWVVACMPISNELNISKLHNRAQNMGRELLTDTGWSKLSVKKTDGNWDDKRIREFSEKLGINIIYPRGKFKSALLRPYFNNDLSMMQYIRKRRNDLAHGLITFESGADNKTHAELKSLADTTIKFMELVVDACHTFVSNNKFLKSAA